MTTPSGPDNGGTSNTGSGYGEAGQGAQPLTPPPAAPAWGQAQQDAPQWGQGGVQAPPDPGQYPQPGYYPVQQPKKKRSKALIIRLTVLGVIAVIAIVSFLVKHFSAAHVDANGTVTKAGTLSVFSLQTGQCFDEPATGVDVSSIKAIPCGQAHDAQVTGNITLTASSYDETALDSDAGDQCQTMADKTVDETKLGSEASIIYFVPNQDDWNSGDHSATCAVDNGTTKLTGSILK
jgi:hypothetical protein